MLVKLAWRNIWRNKRRSLLTILAVAFAVMLSIAMRGLQIGTYQLNIKNAVELFAGYLQIQKSGYQKTPSLQKSFRPDAELRQRLETLPEIAGYAPRVMGSGLISFRENSLGIAILAIDPRAEARVSTILDKVNSGRMFRSDSSAEIVVGETLLRNLSQQDGRTRARVGDTVVVLAQGFDGSLGNLKFRVVGTIKTGAPEFDRGAVLMGLRTADELLAMYGRVNLIAIRLQRLEDIPSVKTALAKYLSGSELAVLDWKEVMPELQQAIELDNIGGILFLGILVMVVAFGITNTILMSVTERFREFGVVLAIGMPQRRLVLLVLIETVLITLVGLALGNVLAAGINAYLSHYPIVFGGEFAELYQEYGFLPQMTSSMKPHIFINITLTVLIIAVFASLYPLLKVWRLEPLRGIRYT